MGAIFNVFPLILIPVLTYNVWAFGATAANNGDGAAVRQHLSDAWVRVPMAASSSVCSKATWLSAPAWVSARRCA